MRMMYWTKEVFFCYYCPPLSCSLDDDLIWTSSLIITGPAKCQLFKFNSQFIIPSMKRIWKHNIYYSYYHHITSMGIITSEERKKALHFAIMDLGTIGLFELFFFYKGDLESLAIVPCSKHIKFIKKLKLSSKL